jgi:hypothetical protein
MRRRVDYSKLKFSPFFRLHVFSCHQGGCDDVGGELWVGLAVKQSCQLQGEMGDELKLQVLFRAVLK